MFSLLCRLGVLMIKEARLLHGVGNQIEQIQKEFQQIQCFLRDANARKDDEETVRNCVAEIREIAYDVEDVIEIFVLRISSRREAGILRRYTSMMAEGLTIHQINSEIKDIKSKISNLTRCIHTYAIRPISQEEHSHSTFRRRPDLIRSNSHLIEADFVGVEKDVENLVANLVNEHNNYNVLAICGMGGLGKTTPAGKIYHHSEVQSHFQAFAWFCVSNNGKQKIFQQEYLLSCYLRKGSRLIA